MSDELRQGFIRALDKLLAERDQLLVERSAWDQRLSDVQAEYLKREKSWDRTRERLTRERAELLWLHAEAVWQRDQTLPEWQCPGCGATTRARMADYPTERDGAAQIVAERRRVVTAKGYDAAHDDQHVHGELLDAARCYANQGRTWFPEFHHKYGTGAGALLDQGWPWWTDDEPDGWKPSSAAVDNLVKAGQFIAAEIDRLVRAAGAS